MTTAIEATQAAPGTAEGTEESWQRPPFEPGNKAAVRHGAYSPALVEPRAKELAEATFASHPHLHLDRDHPAVVRYCQVLARIERVYLWLGDHPELYERLEASTHGPGPHGVFERLEKWERQADRAEQHLALSPLTRARLGLDLQRAELTDAEIAERKEARARLDARLAALDGEAELDAQENS